MSPIGPSPHERARRGGQDSGSDAEATTDGAARGWTGVAERVRDDLRDHQSTLSAAGVAFYGFLSLSPALAAAVFVYGMIADPDEVDAHVRTAFGVLPADVKRLLVSQLSRIADQPRGTLGGSFVVAVVVALWAASKGAAHLLDAIGLAYHGAAHRSVVRRRAVALACTAGAIVAGSVAVTALAVLPDQVPDGGVRWIVRVALWVGLALVGLVGLVLTYRFGAGGDESRWAWTAPGSVLALVGLVLVTVGMCVYVTQFGSYNATYGTLAGVVILLLWLHLVALIVIVGAHVNATLERQETAVQREGATARGGDDPNG